MSKRQVIVLWAIALLLVVSLIAVKSSRNEGFESATARDRGDTLIADLEPTEVAKLEIRQGDTSTVAVKKDGAWVIENRDDYPADTPAINDLLRTIDEVKITQGIETDPSFAPRFGMDPKASDESERGTEVVLANDAGSELAHLTFGKNVEGESNPMNPLGGGGASGRFVLNHADDSGVYITSELFPTLDADASAWLDESFIRVEQIESVSVSEPGKADRIAWKLSREDASKDFVLEGKKDDESIDNTALSAYKNLLSYARFEDVVPAAGAADLWLADQKRSATIKTFEGFTYQLEIGPKKGDTDSFLMTVAVSAEIRDERVKPDEETEEAAKEAEAEFVERKKALEDKLAAEKTLASRTFQVAKYTLDPLLKERSDFISDPNAAPPAAGAPGGLPPGFNPGMMRPGGVQAVTPPVAVPPRPQE